LDVALPHAPFADYLVYPDIENEEFHQILKNGVHAASKLS
jgi:hypothetical protein